MLVAGRGVMVGGNSFFLSNKSARLTYCLPENHAKVGHTTHDATRSV